MHEVYPNAKDFEVAACAVCRGWRVRVGDVVFFECERGNACGEVLSHVQPADHEAYTIVSSWERLAEDVDPTWSVFRVPVSSSVVVVLTAQIEMPVMCKRTGDRAFVLSPFRGV